MKKKLSISGYCTVRDNKVILDGRTLFESPGTETREFLSDVYRHFSVNYPKFHKMDNLSKLGFLAAEILLREKVVTGRFRGEETGIILMNSSSSLDTDRNHQKTISDSSDYFPSPAVFVYTLPNVVIGEICIRHRILGEGNFFVAEKFNPGFMSDIVTQLFDDDFVTCCIAGWAEVNGNNYESVLFLIEETGETETGIAKFEPAAIESIFNRK